MALIFEVCASMHTNNWQLPSCPSRSCVNCMLPDLLVCSPRQFHARRLSFKQQRMKICGWKIQPGWWAALKKSSQL